jgi:hypothetical protein
MLGQPVVPDPKSPSAFEELEELCDEDLEEVVGGGAPCSNKKYRQGQEHPPTNCP